MCRTATWFSRVVDTWKEPEVLSVSTRNDQTENETFVLKACCKATQFWPRWRHLNARSSSRVTWKTLYWGWTDWVVCGGCCSMKGNLTKKHMMLNHIPKDSGYFWVLPCCLRHLFEFHYSVYGVRLKRWPGCKHTFVWHLTGGRWLASDLFMGRLLLLCVCARARKHFHNVRINMTFQWRKWLTADTIQTTMKYKCQKSK